MHRGILCSVFGLVLILATGPSGEAQGRAALAPGQSCSVRIPEPLRVLATYEGYFYTHGPVLVYAYESDCAVTIRDPANPDPPIRQGTATLGIKFEPPPLPAGFYYISLTKQATVFAGVSSTDRCNGFYHFRSTEQIYGNESEASLWYTRGTDGCDNQFYIFAPEGNVSGLYCQDPLCIEDSTPFSIQSSLPGTQFVPGDWYGRLEVTSGMPVQLLARDGPGYFAPPYSSLFNPQEARFLTMQAVGEGADLHCFVEGATVTARTMQGGSVWSGVMGEGETRVLAGHMGARALDITAPKGSLSVAVTASDNYMTYVLDAGGNMQGADFITRSVDGGFIYVTGLDDGTTVEVRDAATGSLQQVYVVDGGTILNVNPGQGIWRIKSTKDVTVCVGKGKGATVVPMTKNVTGSTPFPPAIVGITWTPYSPRTSDNSLLVRWLTDELCTSEFKYRVGTGSWQTVTSGVFATEHSATISLAGLSQDTLVAFQIKVTDQSSSSTTSQIHTVMVRQNAPSLQVSLDSVTEQSFGPYTYWNLLFSVTNNGYGDAQDVRIRFRLRGMQPFEGSSLTCDYSEIGNDIIIGEARPGNVPVGWTVYGYLNVKPFLSHRGNVDYRLLGCSLQARDDEGHTLNSTLSITHDWNDAAVESRMADAHYVVLANLQRFFQVNSNRMADAEPMPREMAKFAQTRRAVLAYTTSQNQYDIRDYIQSRLDGKINQSWHNGGYLLLVGCSAVMPSWTWDLSCTAAGTDRITMSDNTYANIDNDGHYTPELCVGRITGNHPDDYVALFQNALTPLYRDRAISLSGTDPGESTFYDNANRCFYKYLIAWLYPTGNLLRMSTFASNAERLDQLKNNVGNCDFIYHRDHGGVGSWQDIIGWNDVSDLSFGSKHPIVCSISCLTGQIQTSNNMAEEFISNGAAVYIGSTEVSPRSQNNSFGEKICSSHVGRRPIGESFRNAKRQLAGGIKWFTWCYYDRRIKRVILEYNLCGDPWRGAETLAPLPPSPGKPSEPPPPYIELSIPMFEVRPGPDDRDHVFIPDEHAGELLFNNEPIVPTYIWSAVCPPGMRVNDILLADRGGETHASDLWLPTEWGSEKENPGPGDVPSPGVFPPDDFHWTSIELPDGGAEVVLTVHPFQYDYYAREATFWRNWAFDLDLVESAVAIDEVQTVTHTVTANGEQIITVTCSNGGPATEHVDLILSINDMANAVVYNVTRTVSIAPRGVERVDVPWEVSGHSPGDHQVTVRTRHAETGKELDVAYTRFRVGVPDVRVGSPYFHSTEQGIIGDGEQVVLGMEVESAGDVPVSGTSYLQIRRTTDGLILDEWESGFYDLEPFHGHDYNLVWDSTGTPHGEYELLGWAVHDGGITDIASIPFRTMENMRFAWWMAKDVYQPGEKIVATGELYDPSGKAIGPADSILPGLFFWDIPWMIPLVSQHSFEPHYSTSFFVTAAQPTGPYALAVIAGKTGYRSTLGGRWFVVTDQGFPMWAEPPICVADGISSVTVTTGTVVQGTFVVPDGTRMTVHTWGGRILEEDVDPADGHQVASEGGHFTFHWQAPPTTSLDSFVFGTLGDNQPMSGVTVRFKGIDFNGNRWVDVSDIVRVVAAEGLSFGAGDYDYRLDVNEEGIINEEDSFTVAERWSLELAEGVRYATAVPTPGQFGVTLRPEPQTAVIPPGGEIAIAIVADGLDDFGGFEFGCGLFGEALTFAAPPEYTPALETTGNFILPFEPQPTDFGYRIGAYARGGHAGPVGSATVAMLFLHAPQEGETSLILSDPVFVRTDGVEQAVKRSIEGVYIVGEPIPTPTITPTVPAPTVTPTLPVSTPTVTPTGTPEPKSSDFNGDSAVNELDLLTLMRWFHTDAVDYDLNNDHYVDSEDLFLFCHHWQEEYQKPEPE